MLCNFALKELATLRENLQEAAGETGLLGLLPTLLCCCGMFAKHWACLTIRSSKY
jgi:hypothetical protein